MSYIDPQPKKAGFSEFMNLHTAIPKEIKESFISLSDTDFEYAYMENPGCFTELEGDTRLMNLRFDNSLASQRLWSFLLSEEERLHKSEKPGKTIIGAMKDLGTVPIIAYANPDNIAFYPDGAWWIPCVMEMSEGLLKLSDRAGVGDEFCPARAALAAFINRAHFPIPDLLVGAVGSCCDDFSAIMSRISTLGYKTHWWELPYRREEEPGNGSVRLPTGVFVSEEMVDYVEGQLESVKTAIEETNGTRISDSDIAGSIAKTNKLRILIQSIRDMAYRTNPCPLPSLEAQIVEMIALHFCSDMDESINVISHIEQMMKKRVANGEGILPADNCRVVWVNPVADLRVMNLVEDLGGRIAGTEYLFRHALIQIPTDIKPMRALAQTALCDPMIGPSIYRAKLVADEAVKYSAEGVIISDIPGASHCATEGRMIRDYVADKLSLPVLEITVPPLTDSAIGQISTRLEAFFEVIKDRRNQI